MSDDAIREIHGVHVRGWEDAKEKIITIREREHTIILDRFSFSDAAMTPWQARYLASKLYRLARRIRNRTEAEND